MWTIYKYHLGDDNMPSFKKLDNGKYRVSIYLGLDPTTGKQVRTNRTVRTKREGKLLEDRLRLEFETNKELLANKRYKYQEVYDMWLDEYADTVKDSTLMKTKTLFRLHILPILGTKYIDSIKPMELQQIVNNWAKTYVKTPDMASYMALVFNYALRLEIIDKNPSLAIKKPSKKRLIEEYNKDSKKIKYYNKEQFALFLDTLYHSGFNSRVQAMFTLLAFTGMRRQELLALRWIDVTSKTVNIDKAVVRNEAGLYIGTTKTSAAVRIISIDKNTYKIVKQYKEDKHPSSDTDLIFSDNGKTVPAANNPRVWLTKIQDLMDEKAGKTIPRITTHGLRHTHASLLFEAGANIKEVQDRLGHSDIKTTMDIYTHVTQKARDKTADKFFNYIQETN